MNKIRLIVNNELQKKIKKSFLLKKNFKVY